MCKSFKHYYENHKPWMMPDMGQWYVSPTEILESSGGGVLWMYPNLQVIDDPDLLEKLRNQTKL